MKQNFRKTEPQLRRAQRTVLLAGVVSLCLTGCATRPDDACAAFGTTNKSLVVAATNVLQSHVIVGSSEIGGSPDGKDDHCIRFIRMKYDGPGWDDGMDAVSRADLNFLDSFHKLTEFKVATNSESHRIRLLRKYPKGYAPPFVYMTGTGDIHVSSNEVMAMREYLVGGGLLFASAGSPQWGPSFTNFIGQVFPGQNMQEIADDDPLFREPYVFEHGAPPLWHHSGKRVLGVKHHGRWVVYFHPGGVHNAWKTGHSGMDPALAEEATKVGINVIYYAFTHYLEMTRQYRY